MVDQSCFDVESAARLERSSFLFRCLSEVEGDGKEKAGVEGG